MSFIMSQILQEQLQVKGQGKKKNNLVSFLGYGSSYSWITLLTFCFSVVFLLYISVHVLILNKVNIMVKTVILRSR